jgi:adenine-specific DNA-methyltransferase
MPTPFRTPARCSNCGGPFDLTEATLKWIVSETRSPGYLPLLVGESVRRYALGPLAWLRHGIPGIKYKRPEIYRGPKLLVRKTGVGVSATIDYADAYTNQVVYIFRLHPAAPTHVTLECMLALLNSRAMYFFLAKQHGETEWRSHPYLTQAQILGLPAPEFASAGARRAADTLTALVRPVLRGGNPLTARLDALVERHVARLLGLTRSDYKAIYDTLDTVEALLPVRALKSVALSHVFPD